MHMSFCILLVDSKRALYLSQLDREQASTIATVSGAHKERITVRFSASTLL